MWAPWHWTLCFNAMANQPIRYIGTLLCLACMALPAWADVFVVTASSSPIESIGAKDLQSLYMGRSVDLNDGNVRAIDLPRENPLRDRFYTTLTGLSVAQVNSHWSRLLFSGKARPPSVFSNETALLNYLLRTPTAVGYTASPPSPTSGLKVLLVLRTESSQTNP